MTLIIIASILAAYWLGVLTMAVLAANSYDKGREDATDWGEW